MVNEPENRDPELDAVEARILRERDELLAERSHLMQARQELLARQRQADRRLADCRATARFFGLKIDFPDEESEQIDRIERDRIQRERAIRIAERERMLEMRASLARHDLDVARAQKDLTLINQPPSASVSTAAPAIAGGAISAPRMVSLSPKSLREVILDRIEAAGAAGSKAAAIREFYERTFGKTIHQKTVGMTLYRLQNDGLVRHEGHFWFLAPPKSETGNPGVSAPGPFDP